MISRISPAPVPPWRRPARGSRRLAVLRHVIFDVDGTLAETEEAHRCAFNESFAAHGLHWHWDIPTYTALLRVAGGKERMAFYAASAGAPAVDAALIAALHADKTARYTARVAQGGCPFRPGIAQALAGAAARGIGLAIATTTSRANVAALLGGLLGPDWAGRFGAVAAAEDAPAKKPCPDVYRVVLQRLGAEAAECLAVEDSPNGMQAAQRAGIPVVITRSLYFAHDAFPGALAVVDTLEEAGGLAGLIALHEAGLRG